MILKDDIANSPREKTRSLLEEVCDPEVPVLSILDLGIVRDIIIKEQSESAPRSNSAEPAGESGSVGSAAAYGTVPGGKAAGTHGTAPGGVEIVITPTYSGCPAMDVIRMNIRMALLEQGYGPVTITTVLSPAWTTDWMSEAGKEKLKAYGIAPPTPVPQVCHPGLFRREAAIPCPRCNSYHTELISEFGSTACKSLYRCLDCLEPFDHFKCH